MKRPTVLRVPLDQIEPPDVQLRDQIGQESLKALADSMARVGLLQPILVRKADDHWQIVAGHRRYLAAVQLRWLHIDAIAIDVPGAFALTASAHENLFREALTPMEEAALIGHLCDIEYMSYDQIAVALSRTPAWVEGRHLLLAYPPDLQQAIHDGHVPLAAAPHLATIDDAEQRATALEGARTHGMTARAAMEWARQYEVYKIARAAGQPAPAPNLQLVAAEAAKTLCDVCEQQVYINTTKILRICFDCVQAISQGLKAT